MIVILRQGVTEPKIEEISQWLESLGQVNVSVVRGSQTTILGLVGDTSVIDQDSVESNEWVETVKRVQEPYKNANRKFHPDDTIVEIGGHKIGGEHFQVIAGPCSVESSEQIMTVAQSVKSSGAHLLRGGAFKPRTSPYSFQGMRAEGIELLLEARKATGLPIVTEIMSLAHLDLFNDVDVIQIGARNMQNFEMLKELGHCQKPILLKRGLANTIEELLMSAEYIMAGGNNNVILCERGIRTFEKYTRNTLDLSAVPVLKRLSHLPVVIDPSHATGFSYLVTPLAKDAVAVGEYGLLIEVHNYPAKALFYGAQSLNCTEFEELMQDLKRRIAFENRVM